MNQYHKTKREVIFSYLDRFPDAASNCLARMIYKAEPILFASKEHVRSIIRVYRGDIRQADAKFLYSRSCEYIGRTLR
jgi:hypothetical protein